MSHQHEHAGSHHSGHEHQAPKGGGLHKDWRAWTVVILMLLGMAAYILSGDEQENPNAPAGEEPAVPAAP
jgi:hypothetical protein